MNMKSAANALAKMPYKAIVELQCCHLVLKKICHIQPLLILSLRFGHQEALYSNKLMTVIFSILVSSRDIKGEKWNNILSKKGSE